MPVSFKANTVKERGCSYRLPALRQRRSEWLYASADAHLGNAWLMAEWLTPA